MPSAVTHSNKFTTFPDRRVEGDQIVVIDPDKSDVVEVPACGFRTVTWTAQHPERGWESGAMLVSRDPYADEPYARNIVSEILWGRGYMGDYRVMVVP